MLPCRGSGHAVSATVVMSLQSKARIEQVHATRAHYLGHLMTLQLNLNPDSRHAQGRCLHQQSTRACTTRVTMQSDILFFMPCNQSITAHKTHQSQCPKKCPLELPPRVTERMEDPQARRSQDPFSAWSISSKRWSWGQRERVPETRNVREQRTNTNCKALAH